MVQCIANMKLCVVCTSANQLGIKEEAMSRVLDCRASYNAVQLAQAFPPAFPGATACNANLQAPLQGVNSTDDAPNDAWLTPSEA